MCATESEGVVCGVQYATGAHGMMCAVRRVGTGQTAQRSDMRAKRAHLRAALPFQPPPEMISNYA
eukprot:1973854-Rhodomonas_salina.1